MATPTAPEPKAHPDGSQQPFSDAVRSAIGDLTAYALAKMTGIFEATILSFIRSNQSITLATADRLAVAIGAEVALRVGVTGRQVDPRPGSTQPFSDALRSAIDGSGLTPCGLAKKTGIGDKVIRHFLECGPATKLATADRLAVAIGLAVVIVRRDRDPIPQPEARADRQLEFFAAPLLSAINSSGLTPFALARKSGVTLPSIYGFIKEERDIRFATAVKLADALGLKLEPARIRAAPAEAPTLAEAPAVEPAKGKRPDPIPWRGTQEELDREIQAIASEAVRDVVRTLIKLMSEEPARRTKAVLAKESNHGDAVNLLKDFADSGSRLGRAIVLPGQGRRCGYRIEIEIIRST